MSSRCVTVVRYSDIPKGEDTLKLPKMRLHVHLAASEYQTIPYLVRVGAFDKDVASALSN